MEVCHDARAVSIPSDELLRRKVKALMKQRGITQIQLAARLDMSQSLLSRRITGVQRFQVTDLDDLARAFGVTVPELFFDEYGQWDRRSGSDRRRNERRQARQTIYDARIEITPLTSRLSFPPIEKD